MRGFTRFLRDHQRRAAIPYAIDLAYFSQEYRDYIKLGLAPWAVNTKPPRSIRMLWVSRLVADFHRWHQELATRYSDFYLAVWLCEPEFGRSQLVAGIEERQAWYEGLFNYDLKKPLPTEYQSTPGVTALKWTACPEIVTYWLDEFAELGAWVANKPHWKTETADGKPFFVVQIGIVWVGEAAD
ncbi:hypothetical protein GO988_15175 [Hymenobacter sp. HMF4947]|uniref:Uncharacterized protein n=1 Tax=Hymenobacter ginkgonis TaxID=2682976 RepID=A0A7K1TH42_9BACT|nr:hypothetical protein [Hymenobacter ginkgonis]MVN77673.1 hypothetical protein [Hymenobacter ginkgonis]